MTWIDILPIVLLIGYGAGGFFSGLIRRFIGLVALFIALWAATNMGHQAGAILQQTSSFEVADGSIYGFFGIILFVLVIVEAATQLAHSQIQIQAVILNRTFGIALGVLTAILLSVVVVYEFGPYRGRAAGLAPGEHSRRGPELIVHGQARERDRQAGPRSVLAAAPA